MKTYSREELVQMLRAHRITPTHQRVEIAHALFSRGEHLSADQVLNLVNRGSAHSSKATVYNTLNLFRERNLIRQVLVDPGRVFYDPNVAPHHHLYDIDTGELTDIDASDVRVTGLPSLPQGTTAEGVDIVVRVRSRAD